MDFIFARNLTPCSALTLPANKKNLQCNEKLIVKTLYYQYLEFVYYTEGDQAIGPLIKVALFDGARRIDVEAVKQGFDFFLEKI